MSDRGSKTKDGEASEDSPRLELVRSVLPESVLVGLRRARAGVPVAPGEDELLATLPPTQRESFATARALARELARVEGVVLGPILRDGAGAPWWPRGVLGSIAYEAFWCAVAISVDGVYEGLGLDLDRVELPPRDGWDGISTPDEVSQLGWLAPEVAVDLIWSAKEAFYKAQYPLTKNSDLEPRDVTFMAEGRDGHFTITPAPSELRCIGRLALRGGWCAAGVVLVGARTPRPVLV